MEIETEDGCRKCMGDVYCGDVIETWNEHRGVKEIQVFYCKNCSKKITEKKERKEERAIAEANHIISNIQDEGGSLDG